MTFKHKLARRLAQNDPAAAAAQPVPAHLETVLAQCSPPTAVYRPQHRGLLLRSVPLLALALVMSAGCMQEATNSEVQNSIIQLAIWPKSVTLGVGQSTRFVAYGLTSANDSVLAEVTWSATGGAISADGEFTAGADTGAFGVTATHALKLWLEDSATVEVQEVAPELVRLVLWPRDPTVPEGDSLDFFAVGLTAAGDTMLVDVTWTVDGGALISRGQGHGRYKPTQSGTHGVKASGGGLSDSTTVTVTPAPVASVDVAPATATVGVGQTQQLTAVMRDASGNTLTGRVVSWSTSATGVATVNGSGLVTAVAAGSATITATSEGHSGTAAITVSVAPVATVTVTPASASLTVGQTRQLTAVTRDAAGNTLTGRTVTWATSAAGVATVSGSGLVTGVAAGSATITATSEGHSGPASVTVTAAAPRVAQVVASPDTVTLTSLGAWVTVSAIARDSVGNAIAGITFGFQSSNPSIATVDTMGRITARAVGAAVVTVTALCCAASDAVIVNVNQLPDTITVSTEQLALEVGDTTTLSATVRDSLGNPIQGITVAWSSSNGTVASVMGNADGSGFVTGLSVGVTDLTAVASKGGKQVTVIIPTTVSEVATGNSIVLSGSGFGTKSPAAPVYFSTFENATVGAGMEAPSVGLEILEESGTEHYPVVSNARAHSGTKAIVQSYLDVDDTFVGVGTTDFPAGSLDYYIGQWVYFERVSASGQLGLLKLGRAGAGDPYQGVPKYWNTSQGNVSTDIGYNNGSQDYDAETDDPSLKIGFGQWGWYEDLYRLSTPGVANGFYASYMNNHAQAYAADAVTRAAGVTETLEWAIMAFDGCEPQADWKLWVDELLIDKTWARVIATDNATYANSTKWAPQAPTAWSDTQITIGTPNWGNLTRGSTAYFHVFNANNTHVAAVAKTVP